MARVLIDTNIWLRRLDRTSPLKPTARRALLSLRASGDEPVIVPQTVFEMWVVLTRPPTARGGFGFTPEAANVRVKALLEVCPLLPDSPDVFPTWLDLVRRYHVQGTKSHDARLVASMKVHGVQSILTFNVSDFQAFAPEGISVLDPRSL